MAFSKWWSVCLLKCRCLFDMNSKHYLNSSLYSSLRFKSCHTHQISFEQRMMWKWGGNVLTKCTGYNSVGSQHCIKQRNKNKRKNKEKLPHIGSGKLVSLLNKQCRASHHSSCARSYIISGYISKPICDFSD